jgi:hypothetical protein
LKVEKEERCYEMAICHHPCRIGGFFLLAGTA